MYYKNCSFAASCNALCNILHTSTNAGQEDGFAVSLWLDGECDPQNLFDAAKCSHSIRRKRPRPDLVDFIWTQSTQQNRQTLQIHGKLSLLNMQVSLLILGVFAVSIRPPLATRFHISDVKRFHEKPMLTILHSNQDGGDLVKLLLRWEQSG